MFLKVYQGCGFALIWYISFTSHCLENEEVSLFLSDVGHGSFGVFVFKWFWQKIHQCAKTTKTLSMLTFSLSFSSSSLLVLHDDDDELSEENSFRHLREDIPKCWIEYAFDSYISFIWSRSVDSNPLEIKYWCM